MKKAKKLDFLGWNNSILMSSLKQINLNIVLIAVIDALFYLISGYLVIFWLQRIQAKMAAFSIPADITSLGVERAQQLVKEVKSFYFLIIASLILLLIVIIFLMSIFKGIIWAKTTGTKITLKLISKFLALNLVWTGFWFIVVFLISYIIESAAVPMAMVIAIALGLYFTNTLYIIFIKKPQFKSIIHALKINIAKIHLFLLPYISIGFLFYIVLKASSLIKSAYSQIIARIIIIFLIAFIRYYISNLVYGIDKL